jgi:hypothetical protein
MLLVLIFADAEPAFNLPRGSFQKREGPSERYR